MRIYPDPELPDVKVEWGEQDCRDGNFNVAVTLKGIDTESTETVTVPCADLKMAFVDVARERFHVEGTLLDSTGAVLNTSDGGDVDLRNGFNQSTGLYFDGFSNFRVRWSFEGGATCMSLDVEDVQIQISLPDEPDVGFYQYPCELSQATGSVAPGTYTAVARAYARDQSVIGVSAETAPFVVTESGFTDVGTISIAPCGASCP